MKKKRPVLTLGSILTLCLTAVVAVGCIVVFGKIRSGQPDAVMDARRVAGLVGDALQGSTAAPAMDEPVRTVTVTLPPAAEATLPPLPSQAPGAAAQQYSFSLTFAGLMAFESDLSDSVYDKAAKTFDFRPVVAPLAGKICADMNLVALPQTLNVTDTKYADAMAPAAAADAVHAAGFDDALLGTEHILDQGVQGALDTVEALGAKGVSCGGITAGSARQNRIVQLNGARIALLSYTDVLTAKGKNTLAGQNGLMHLYDPDAVRQDIAAARAQGVHCVIVCMYWGKADQTGVTAAQRATARALAEMGADVILGYRPSRVLPVEILSVTGEDGQRRQALAAYSLGTLLSESREAADIAGMLLHLNITVDGAGKVRFAAVEYTPTYIWRQSVGGKPCYRLLCSAEAAPEGMSAQQKGVMERALNRIKTALQDSPVTLRQP